MRAKLNLIRVFIWAVAMPFTLFLNSCNRDKGILPQIAGSWTKMNFPPGDQLLPTGNGLLSYSNSAYDIYNNSSYDTVWYSADHGATWNVALSGPAYAVYTLYTDMMNNMNVVAYSGSDSTFYASQNGGQSWSVLNHLNYNLTGPPAYINTDSGYEIIDSLYNLTTFIGVSNGRLFANRVSPYANNGLGATYLIKSDNQGNSWDTVYTSAYTATSPFYLIPAIEMATVGSLLHYFTYGANLHSNNNGAAWSALSGTEPITNYAGKIANGDVVGLDSHNNTLYLSHDSANTWISAFHNVYGYLGPALAFDSVVLTGGNYYEGWHVLCANPEKMSWYGADNGMGAFLDGGFIITFYADNEYVYAFVSNGPCFRRPRTDFKGI